jgi:nickel-dependent lactate racemase
MTNDQTVGSGSAERLLTDDDVRGIVAEAIGTLPPAGKRLLLIVPDSTRTAPIGQLFRHLMAALDDAAAVDVMIALGTHAPMDDAAICRRLEVTPAERAAHYGRVGFLNHAWDDPAALVTIGTLTAETVAQISDGLFAMDIPVEINRRIFDYDHLVIVGPVFPHEVVGFSGGNKYLFPGIGGPKILNFFHWLAAVIGNPRIIGNKWTPVRQVVDRAAALVPVPRLAFCLVVKDGGLAGLFAGTPEAAWSRAADLSADVHIVRKDRAFHTVLSCAPSMYDEIWVAGKCMYKLEPVVADGGELIIYGPHIRQISRTHGAAIERVGYHVRDYFRRQWDRFKDEPWGVLAHSTHVRGIGAYDPDRGIETPRITVTLATAIPEAVCRRIGLGYRDPATIDPAAYQDREDDGVLYVARAGEMLYRLRAEPAWAQGGTGVE